MLADELTSLTTTRVAERAGVSVGTLYQYFPNKEALLYAVLLNHFERLAEALSALTPPFPDCHSASGQISSSTPMLG
ncbi:TetR/AcrR family transcriptional regulator [Pseudomaricurvus hydrocarbonicus]|uniref:TetR/AcrR family transcriptional regulator n=1 Tax=Pseudomaricurvus hydrocarbonicus TaxID=1470433 RepID=UPI003C7B3E70